MWANTRASRSGVGSRGDELRDANANRHLDSRQRLHLWRHRILGQRLPPKRSKSPNQAKPKSHRDTLRLKKPFRFNRFGVTPRKPSFHRFDARPQEHKTQGFRGVPAKLPEKDRLRGGSVSLFDRAVELFHLGDPIFEHSFERGAKVGLDVGVGAARM